MEELYGTCLMEAVSEGMAENLVLLFSLWFLCMVILLKRDLGEKSSPGGQEEPGLG